MHKETSGSARQRQDVLTALTVAAAALLLALSLNFVRPAFAETDELITTADQVKDASEAAGVDLYHRGFYEAAMKVWKRAVEEKQDPGAAFRLGEEYFDAKVVDRSMTDAVKYMMIGAEGGDPRAQMDLGTYYDKGWGVKHDRELAARWYKAAADNGKPDAQYNIGTMYEDGEGVEKNLKLAYAYYLMAAKNGFPNYPAEAIQRLSKEMEPADIKAASKMAATMMKSQPQDPLAPAAAAESMK
ncbi:TPR repeat protein [Parvibaculum indicum]|uniref:tetratricopeptide repeat protein n=1 Tax=Parvibaculum indicum TaxID=562969 RepID=UPI00141EA19B|nr:tetratricopeptide repeat protein [Parvibaculum indicum]NIJ39879.1 TPR repeat protein [Parvibaculum indicum]